MRAHQLPSNKATGMMQEADNMTHDKAVDDKASVDDYCSIELARYVWPYVVIEMVIVSRAELHKMHSGFMIDCAQT